MTDLESRLRGLRGTTTPVDEDTVRADIGRARRALSRRRRARIGSAAVAVAAVGVVATVIVAGQPGGQGSDIAEAPTPSPTHAATLRLVDYTGIQQPGFTVAKVPAGFVLQGATPYSLDVAKAGDHSSLNDFEGKLVVMLQSKDATFHKTNRAVTVHGTTGYLRAEDGGATALEYLDGDHDVVIQAWSGLGLTDAQLVEFADGVTVTSGAQASVG